MGRSFANLHIKSSDLEKTVAALRKLSEAHPEVLGIKAEQETGVVIYVCKSNETWISVLHDYFVWGTVKKIGKTLSRLVEEPIMTAGYMNEEVFELSFFENGDIQAEKIFCEPWAREDYELQEELLHDDYIREVLELSNEEFDSFIGMTNPQQAVDRLSELAGMSLWVDSEWIPYEEELKKRFVSYQF